MSNTTNPSTTSTADDAPIAVAPTTPVISNVNTAAPLAASPTTSSRLGGAPSPSTVLTERSTDTIDHGAKGLENPFELRTVNGTEFPVWRETGHVPLIAIRQHAGKQAGDSYGLEPSAALDALNGRWAELDGRAINLVGVGGLARFVRGTVGEAAAVRVAADGRDVNGNTLAAGQQGYMRQVGALRADGAVLVGGDGRDASGRVLADVGGPPSYPGFGEPLPSGSGPQPARAAAPLDSRPNASPEGKVIPASLDDVGTEKAKVLEDEQLHLSADDRRRLALQAKSDAYREGLKDKQQTDKVGGTNETAAREKGSDDDDATGKNAGSKKPARGNP